MWVFPITLLKLFHSTACQNNMYGAGCSEKCGHCLNGEHCNHVNGTCHSGCEAGYHGIRCKRGKKNNYNVYYM